MRIVSIALAALVGLFVGSFATAFGLVGWASLHYRAIPAD